jgi:hypothetical protein
MKSKTKNNKVPKTKLSDLTPKKDSRGGKQYPAAPGPGPAPTPPMYNPPPSASSIAKIKYPPPSA